MPLTPKESVIAQIQHHETDPIPYTLSWEEESVAERLDQHYGNRVWRSLLQDAICGVDLPRPGLGLLAGTGEAGETVRDLFGSTWRVDMRPAHLVEAPLKEPALSGYRFPEIEACFDPGWEQKARSQIAAWPDRFTTASFGFGLFERTWTLRGFENVMMDVAAEPAFYASLLDAITEHQSALLERILPLPLDGFMFSDDWGYQEGVLIGADRWRKLLKPRLARLYAQVHAAGKYVITHCCGSIAEILPDLIEIGLDVYESVQPEAKNNRPDELKRRYGDHLTFWGGLGSQSTIPFGTPDEIRGEVGRLCRVMGRGGGFILCPAKALQPETPTENAAAVVESFLLQAGVHYPVNPIEPALPRTQA
jgi:uroporphyrinogen decarboxylase